MIEKLHFIKNDKNVVRVKNTWLCLYGLFFNQNKPYKFD